MLAVVDNHLVQFQRFLSSNINLSSKDVVIALTVNSEFSRKNGKVLKIIKSLKSISTSILHIWAEEETRQ